MDERNITPINSTNMLFGKLTRRELLRISGQAATALALSAFLSGDAPVAAPASAPEGNNGPAQNEIDTEMQQLAAVEGLTSSNMNMTGSEFSGFLDIRAQFNLAAKSGQENAGRFFSEYLPMRRSVEQDIAMRTEYDHLIHRLGQQWNFVYTNSTAAMDPSTAYILGAKLIEDFGIADRGSFRIPIIEKFLKEAVITVSVDLNNGPSSMNIDSISLANARLWQNVTGHGNVSEERESVMAHELGHLLDQKRLLEPEDTTWEQIVDDLLPLPAEEQERYLAAKDTLSSHLFPFPTHGGSMYAYSPVEFLSSTVGVFIADRDYFYAPNFVNNLGFSNIRIFTPEAQGEIREALTKLAGVYSGAFYDYKRE